VTGRVLAVAAITTTLAAPAALADESRLSLTLRGGGLDRNDSGYADHAEAFGLGNPESAGGGVIEAGVRFGPRLWLLGSWSGFTSTTFRRLDQLEVSSQAVLAHLGVTAIEHHIEVNDEPTWLRLDLTAGAGLHILRDELNGETSRDSGPGARLGVQLSYSWRAIGFGVAYGWHLTRVELEDRLGGTLGAGGHEVSAGLSLRY
jgi:hypothetical protein